MIQDNNCPFDVTPLDQSDPIQNDNIINLNYTNQDFWSLKSRLIDFIRTRFENNFSDFIESDLGIMLIECWAFIGDTLSFKIDQVANEIFTNTVTELDNAFRLAELIGYKPTPPIAAISQWRATINTPLTTDLVIDTPILVPNGGIDIELFAADSNNNPLFNEPIVITAGNLVNDSIIGLEGRTITDSTTGNGSANQAILLANSPVIYGSIRVTVDGTEWTKVDYFTDSQQRKEYRVEYNSSYQAYVIFGNNRAGLLPARNSIVAITYRIGGGEVGNIVTGYGNTQRAYDVDNLPFKVPVFFRNFSAGKYGYDGDNVEDIRRNLPKYIRSQNRAVTGLDYKTLADLFATPFHGQIGKSSAILRNHGCAGNIIDLYILARNGENGLEEASNELKADLIEELDNKKMLTDYVCVRNGEIILVDVNIDVMVDKLRKNFEEELRERITRRINSFFRLTEWEFGDNLKEADIIKALSDMRELKTIDVTFITDNEDNSGNLVTSRYFEIIRPDNINISFNFE